MWGNRLVWTVILTLISVLGCWIYAGGHLVQTINGLFMTGLVLLMVAGIFYVINAGFFDAFLRGFQYLKKKSDVAFEDPLDGSGSEGAEQRRHQIRSWVGVLCLSVGLIDTALSFLLLTLM